MRLMTATAASESKGSPVNRLFSVMHISIFFQLCKILYNKTPKANTNHIQQTPPERPFPLNKPQSPEEVDAITDPITREQRRRESRKMREQDEAQLRRLVQAEQDRWARDRSLAEYTIEGSCTREFFKDIKKAWVNSHIEKLKVGHTKIEDI